MFSQVQALIDEDMCINCGKCYMTCNDSGYQVCSSFCCVPIFIHHSFPSWNLTFFCHPGYKVRPGDPPSFCDWQLHRLHSVPHCVSNHKLHPDGCQEDPSCTSEGYTCKSCLLNGLITSEFSTYNVLKINISFSSYF